MHDLQTSCFRISVRSSALEEGFTALDLTALISRPIENLRMQRSLLFVDARLMDC